MSELDFSGCGESSSMHSASETLRGYRAWRRKNPALAFAQYLQRNKDLEPEIVIELATSDLIQQVSIGNPCCAEDYIAAVSDFSADTKFDSTELKLDLVDAEICAKSDLGECVDRNDFLKRFPTMKAELSRLFEVHEIDLEASKSHTELNREPISVPGYQFVRRIDESSASRIASRQFELWEVIRSADSMTLHVVIWESDALIDPLLKKRKQVKHSALAEPLETGVVNGYHYVVIEPLIGSTLGQILDHSAETGLTGKAIARLLVGVTEAREELNESLSVSIPIPLNAIFIRANNTPILIDFPFFVEPESADPLLQLGLLLFSTCLHESDVREVQQHLDAGYEPIVLTEINSSISRELNTIYQSCVHPNPKQRYRTIDEALANLRNFADGKRVKPAKRRKWFGF